MMIESAAVGLATLALLLVAVLAFSPAAAESETEPNDSPQRANDFHSYHAEDTSIHYYPVEGTCDYTPDFVNLRPYPNGAFTITYSLEAGNGAPAEDHLELWAPDGSTIVRIDAEGRGTIQGAALSTGDYSVVVECSGTAAQWTLELDMNAVAGTWRGPDEHEYNNYGPNATYLSGDQVRGAMSAPFDTVDMWRISPSSPDVLVELWPEGSLDAQLATVGPDGSVLTPGEHNLTLRNPALNGIIFAVVARSGSGYYNITITPAGGATAGGAGPDEPDPNDTYGTATVLTVSDGLAVGGFANFSEDAIDWYRFTMPYPSRLVVTISSVGPCEPERCEHLSLLDQDRRQVIDPLGDPLDGKDGFHLAAPEGQMYFLRVDAGFPGGEYTIHFDAEPYPLDAMALVELLEANDTAVVSCFGTPVEQEHSFAIYNIAILGNGVMYGDSFTLLVLNRAPVALQLDIRAGTRLVPENPELSRFVITRNQTVVMGAWTLDEFVVTASIEGPSGKIPSYGHLYFLDGRSAGNQERVTNETGGGSYSFAAEITAVWSANGVNRLTLTQYGASNAAIDEAGVILERAGVSTDITHRTPSPGTGGAGSGGGSLDLALPIVVGAIAIILVVAIAGRRRPRRGGPHTSPPLTEIGAGSGGGTYPPPAYPPTPPFASGPGQTTVRVARPVESPTEPVAPPAESGTAPCPRCGAAVAFYATSCPSCQMALQW